MFAQAFIEFGKMPKLREFKLIKLELTNKLFENIIKIANNSNLKAEIFKSLEKLSFEYTILS